MKTFDVLEFRHLPMRNDVYHSNLREYCSTNGRGSFERYENYCKWGRSHSTVNPLEPVSKPPLPIENTLFDSARSIGNRVLQAVLTFESRIWKQAFDGVVFACRSQLLVVFFVISTVGVCKASPVLSATATTTQRYEVTQLFEGSTSASLFLSFAPSAFDTTGQSTLTGTVTESSGASTSFTGADLPTTFSLGLNDVLEFTLSTTSQVDCPAPGTTETDENRAQVNINGSGGFSATVTENGTTSSTPVGDPSIEMTFAQISRGPAGSAAERLAQHTNGSPGAFGATVMTSGTFGDCFDIGGGTVICEGAFARADIETKVTAVGVPEPSPLLLVALVAVGLGCQRYRSSFFQGHSESRL